MPKKKKEETPIELPKLSSRSKRIIETPTDDPNLVYRLLPRFSNYKISGEVFCKNNDRRRELGLDPIPAPSNEYVE